MDGFVHEWIPGLSSVCVYLRVAERSGAGAPIGSCLLGLRTRECLQTSTVCPLSLLLPSSAKPARPSGHWHAEPPTQSDISLAPALQKDSVCTARLTLEHWQSFNLLRHPEKSIKHFLQGACNYVLSGPCNDSPLPLHGELSCSAA